MFCKPAGPRTAPGRGRSRSGLRAVASAARRCRGALFEIDGAARIGGHRLGRGGRRHWSTRPPFRRFLERVGDGEDVDDGVRSVVAAFAAATVGVALTSAAFWVLTNLRFRRLVDAAERIAAGDYSRTS